MQKDNDYQEILIWFIDQNQNTTSKEQKDVTFACYIQLPLNLLTLILHK